MARPKNLRQKNPLFKSETPVLKPLDPFAPLVVSVQDVATMLKISKSTVGRLDIPGRIKIGGQVRYRLVELLKWLETIPEA